MSVGGEPSPPSPRIAASSVAVYCESPRDLRGVDLRAIFHFNHIYFLPTVGASSAALPDTRLYIGSLHYDLKEVDLKAIFAPFGGAEGLKSVDLSFDPLTGRSKGCV